MTVAPCNCAARWAPVACSCSWRDHLTKPLRVESGWLYDDGTTTEDATLSGLVYPDDTTDDVYLTLANGDVVDVPAADRGRADDDLRWSADATWRRSA